MAINTVLDVICYAVVTAMNRDTWLEQLEMLLIRFSHLGIGADIASMSLIELWAVYQYLLRLTDG